MGHHSSSLFRRKEKTQSQPRPRTEHEGAEAGTHSSCRLWAALIRLSSAGLGLLLTLLWTERGHVSPGPTSPQAYPECPRLRFLDQTVSPRSLLCAQLTQARPHDRVWS